MSPPERAGEAVGSSAPKALKNELTEAQTQELLRSLRAKRYSLLGTARNVLLACDEAQSLEFPHNHHRTCKCAWITHTGTVGVHKAVESSKAFYSGLTTCGNVWTCPVCSAKVQERRREEIALAIQWAYGQDVGPAKGRVNGQAMMVTLTFPHKYWQKLADLLEQQKYALELLRGGKSWTKIKESIGFSYLIRSLEITRGDNGWHPHTHELWFVDADVDAKKLLKKLKRRWLACCIKAGLVDPNDFKQIKAFLRHAVHLKEHCSESDYLAKQDSEKNWGVDREIAKASTKAGRATGRHPFELLAEVEAGGVGTAHAAELFREFAAAMYKKQQLLWSKKFKKLLGLQEKTDEEIAEEQREKAMPLGLIPRENWKLVRAYGARAYVLDLAEKEGWWAIEQLLDHLVELDLEAKLQEPSAQSPPHGGDGARGAPPG